MSPILAYAEHLDFNSIEIFYKYIIIVYFKRRYLYEIQEDFASNDNGYGSKYYEPYPCLC